MMNELRELFKYVDRASMSAIPVLPPSTEEGEIAVRVDIPARLLRVLRAAAEAGAEAHAWSNSSVLVAELAREREKARGLLETLRGLVESIEAEQRGRGLADYTEGFVKAYDAAKAALRV